MNSGDPLFTEAEIRSLLAREEGQFLEFKSLWDRQDGQHKTVDRRKARDFVAENVSAFANADGGVLLLGVDDDGAPSGHGYPDEVVAELLGVPSTRLRPAVRCRTARVVIDGREILVFDVGLSSEAVMVEGNGFPYRVDDTVRREPQEVINRRKQAYRTVGYEPRIRTDATVEDLDLDLARRFLGRGSASPRPIEELLERFGLVQPRGSGLAITNAALLLFAKERGLRWHPRAGIRFFRVAGKDLRHGTQRNVGQLERFDPPLARALPEALAYAATQVRRSEKLHDLFFREIAEYPEFAWQEALVNAVAHRDYEEQGREIEVWFFEDRMEVRSPGTLVPPATLEALQRHERVHVSRNPLVVRALVESGVMRDEGEGIPRMFDEMERGLLRAPQLSVANGVFQVLLSNEPIFVGPSAEWQQLVEKLSISTAQRRILLARPERFTNEDYRTLNQVDRDDAYRAIQELVDAGIVTPSGGHGRAASWHVADNLHQARAFLEARVPKLREHFERESRLTNADYRELFSLSRDAAKVELRGLVQQGFLRLEGERRAAHYRPLPPLGVRSTGTAT